MLCLSLLILFVGLCIRFCRDDSQDNSYKYGNFEDEEVLIKVVSPLNKSEQIEEHVEYIQNPDGSIIENKVQVITQFEEV